ncbi:MAG: hypothetical protein PHG06_03975 [Parabacteroides sp.]|nr:hypothetical protein [Parabacteroides sp.]
MSLTILRVDEREARNITRITNNSNVKILVTPHKSKEIKFDQEVIAGCDVLREREIDFAL